MCQHSQFCPGRCFGTIQVYKAWLLFLECRGQDSHRESRWQKGKAGTPDGLREVQTGVTPRFPEDWWVLLGLVRGGGGGLEGEGWKFQEARQGTIGKIQNGPVLGEGAELTPATLTAIPSATCGWVCSSIL